MKNLVILTFITILALNFAGCALTKTTDQRTPSSVKSAMETEADQFMEEIENKPSRKY